MDTRAQIQWLVARMGHAKEGALTWVDGDDLAALRVALKWLPDPWTPSCDWKGWGPGDPIPPGWVDVPLAVKSTPKIEALNGH